MFDLKAELVRFSYISDLSDRFARVTSFGDFIYKIEPLSKTTNKVYGLMALVHGNETLGLPLINQILEKIIHGKIELAGDLFVGLGHVPAAFENKRFLEEDLNRCFGLSSASSWEARRARQLETLMLNHCHYLIDLHQTVLASRSPFFIFQYSSPRCLSMIEQWNPGIPTIFQFEQIGENTGLSSDEYLRSRGQFGAALELGEKGTEFYLDLGFSICENYLKTVPDENRMVRKPKVPLFHYRGTVKAQRESRLSPDWENLSSFRPGEKIGTSHGEDVLTETSGWMLFPRQQLVKPGETLYHYCTEIDLKLLLPQAVSQRVSPPRVLSETLLT